MPNEEQLDRLTAEVRSLSAEVNELRERVARLEQPAAIPIQTFATPAPARTSPANTGLKLLNRVGALTLFLGIIFFFKYAVDNQWIGAAGRVGLGVIGGFALLGAGEWLRRRGQSIFAQGLSACGIATLYISAYAACDYYKLINSISAFIALVAISLGALALSWRNSDAVLATVGYLLAVGAPGLLRIIDPKIWSSTVWACFGFVYLFATQASVVLQAGTHWKRFLVPVVATAVALQAFWLINPGHPVVCVLFFLALAALHFRSPVGSAYVIGHLFILLGGFRFLVFWIERAGSPEMRASLLSETESVFLGIYGVALLVAAVVRRSAADRVLGLALLGVVIAKLYMLDVWLLTRIYRISAFVALGVLLLAGSFIYSRWKAKGV